MNAGQCNLMAACLLLTLSGCASSGAAGSAAVAAPGPPPGQPPANVYIAATPAAGPPPTLPQFLGIEQCKQHTVQAFGGLSNFVHRLFPFLDTAFPGAEGRPPLQPLSSPANLESPSPAVAAAAKIKQEEDQAQQKILALNYLATVGCGGCYPEVEAAFLAAMDDCTEEVRFAAVKAVKEAAGQPCKFCKNGACCSSEIRRKLIKLSENQGDDCCPAEPSPRVRRLARIALANCGNQNLEPVPELEGPVPTDEWELLPPPEGTRDFSADGSEVPTVDFAAAEVESKSVTKPENSDSREVDELVTKWYRTVDPTLPIEKKEQLLQRYLASQFRKLAEERALIQLARDEFVFRDGLQAAFTKTTLAHVPPSNSPRSTPQDGVAMASHTKTSDPSITAVSHQSLHGLFVSWEQIRLEVREGKREEDLAIMNEIWRVVNKRKPDPSIRIDKDRLRVTTSGLVDLRDVSNPQLRKLLAATAIGECSSVVSTNEYIFIVRILDRIDKRPQVPKVLD